MARELTKEQLKEIIVDLEAKGLTPTGRNAAEAEREWMEYHRENAIRMMQEYIRKNMK